MTDDPSHLTVIEGTLEEPTQDDSPTPPVTAPITLPRGYKRWKRKSFSDGLIEAYHRLGGIDYLVSFGRDHPAEFIKACSRLIPRELQSSIVGEVTIVHVLRPTALDVHEDAEASCRVKHIIDGSISTAPGDGDKE